MIITIDGYAGTGKSTAAKTFAAAISFPILNTGGMYRAIGYHLVRRDVSILGPLVETARIREILADATFDMPGHEIRFNCEMMNEFLFNSTVGNYASIVAEFEPVRTRLKAEQRRIAADKNYVCEGRDQGTEVFPKAECKFFFTCDPRERAKRASLTDPRHLEEIERDILTRDHRDETRLLDPLRKPDDAIIIDTTTLTPAMVLEQMLEHFHTKR